MSETEEAFVRLCRLVGLHPQMDDDLDVFEAAADEISRLKLALGKVVEAKMPGEARSIARHTLLASDRNGEK